MLATLIPNIHWDRIKNWIKNEMIYYRISELMLATLVQRYDKKIISFEER